jgi:hypothetical protein
MGTLKLGYTGQLYFKDVEEKDTKRIMEHVRHYVGTGTSTYLKDSKTLCVNVAGEVETELSLMDLARGELEEIQKRSGADRFELSVVD